MKITKSQLKKLIKEEIQNVLNEVDLGEIQKLIKLVCADPKLPEMLKNLGVKTPRELMEGKIISIIDSDTPLQETEKAVTDIASLIGRQAEVENYKKIILDTGIKNPFSLPGFPESITIRWLAVEGFELVKGMPKIPFFPSPLDAAREVAKSQVGKVLDVVCTNA